jgi:hypothetical protein
MTQLSRADVSIATQTGGFYQGFNIWVAAVPKVVILSLILWVAMSPELAGAQLMSLQTWSTASVWRLVYLRHRFFRCRVPRRRHLAQDRQAGPRQGR